MKANDFYYQLDGEKGWYSWREVCEYRREYGPTKILSSKPVEDQKIGIKKIHLLKTWPEYFSAIRCGDKKFEVRKNDRNFQSGDYVTLQEWNPTTKEYTGESETFQIGFLVDSEWGLQNGYCAFALLKIDESDDTYNLHLRLAQTDKDLSDAQYHLLSMVNQYCMNTVKKIGTEDTYSHAFMSAGEGAFDYLVGHKLAKWCANGVDICKLKWPEEPE
jgi:hypothetical protein